MVFRTFSGLASRKNQRRRPSAIRFTPYHGLPRFSSRIFSTTGRGTRRPGRGAACRLSPISPSSRYCRSQSIRELWLTPVSAHTSAKTKPSSRRSFTALSFSSNVYLFRRLPSRLPRFADFSTSVFSSMVTLLLSLECHPILALFCVYDLVVSTIREGPSHWNSVTAFLPAPWRASGNISVTSLLGCARIPLSSRRFSRTKSIVGIYGLVT